MFEECFVYFLYKLMILVKIYLVGILNTNYFLRLAIVGLDRTRGGRSIVTGLIVIGPLLEFLQVVLGVVVLS